MTGYTVFLAILYFSLTGFLIKEKNVDLIIFFGLIFLRLIPAFQSIFHSLASIRYGSAIASNLLDTLDSENYSSQNRLRDFEILTCENIQRRFSGKLLLKEPFQALRKASIF